MSLEVVTWIFCYIDELLQSIIIISFYLLLLHIQLIDKIFDFHSLGSLNL